MKTYRYMWGDIMMWACASEAVHIPIAMRAGAHI